MSLASRLKPRPLAQHPGKGNTARVYRDEIIKLLLGFRVFPKAHVDAGTQERRLDEARKSRSVLAIVPAVANFADSERRAVQAEIDTLLVAVFYLGVAVVTPGHDVERLDRLELEPSAPGC